MSISLFTEIAPGEIFIVGFVAVVFMSGIGLSIRLYKRNKEDIRQRKGSRSPETPKDKNGNKG